MNEEVELASKDMEGLLIGRKLNNLCMQSLIDNVFIKATQHEFAEQRLLGQNFAQCPGGLEEVEADGMVWLGPKNDQETRKNEMGGRMRMPYHLVLPIQLKPFSSQQESYKSMGMEK